MFCLGLDTKPFSPIATQRESIPCPCHAPSVIMGKQENDWQDATYVLKLFAVSGFVVIAKQVCITRPRE